MVSVCCYCYFLKLDLFLFEFLYLCIILVSLRFTCTTPKRYLNFSLIFGRYGVSGQGDYMNFSSVNFKYSVILLLLQILFFNYSQTHIFKPTSTTISQPQKNIPPTIINSQTQKKRVQKNPNIKKRIKKTNADMSSTPFPLITVSQTETNQNASYGLTEVVQYNMSNDISREMKMSYSIPTIALQIVNRFFHIRCYINYDRFMIILAALVLACKLKYMDFKIKDIVYSFYRVMCFKCQTNQPFDQKMLNKIKDEICVAQNEILRSLEYDIDVTTPHDYLPKILQLSFPPQMRTPLSDKIKITTRILILDSNRVQSSLYFSPLVICVSALMISSRYEGVKPYMYMVNGSKSTESSHNEKTDEDMYVQWLDAISNSEGEQVKQDKVLQCVKHLNQVFKLVVEV